MAYTLRRSIAAKDTAMRSAMATAEIEQTARTIADGGAVSESARVGRARPRPHQRLSASFSQRSGLLLLRCSRQTCSLLPAAGATTTRIRRVGADERASCLLRRPEKR